jgi:hypothetical protein
MSDEIRAYTIELKTTTDIERFSKFVEQLMMITNRLEQLEGETLAVFEAEGKIEITISGKELLEEIEKHEALRGLPPKPD